MSEANRTLNRRAFFVIIRAPDGAKPVTREDRMAVYSTSDEARSAAWNLPAVEAYGAEIFEVGTGDEI